MDRQLIMKVLMKHLAAHHMNGFLQVIADDILATQQPIELKEDWISVEDALPDKDKLYLTFTKSPRTSSIGINMFDSEMKQFPSSFTTHWRPLPEPPQTKG